jgi:WD40 repeat protein
VIFQRVAISLRGTGLAGWAVVALMGGPAAVYCAGFVTTERRPPGQVSCICHEAPPWSVAFSPDGRTLATATWCGGNTVREVDVETGRAVVVRQGEEEPGWQVGFSPDGRLRMFAAWGSGVRLFEEGRGERRWEMPPGVEAWRAVLSPDGARMAVFPWGGLGVILLDRCGGWQTVLGTERVRSLAFAPDGKGLAIGGWDGSLVLWDADAGRIRVRVPVHRSPVVAVAFSPDGARVATGALLDQAVRVWDASGGAAVANLPASCWRSPALAFSPDGALLASLGYDSTVLIWDVASGRELAVLGGTAAPIQALAFSPDGRLLATGGKDNALRIWDVARLLAGGPAPAGRPPG